MRDYILFLDTEASGLPKKWDQPYSNSSNWPCAVQLAWLIYTNDGKLIKSENHFIAEKDIKIAPSAQKIHSISSNFLEQNGKSRQSVMQLLADDLMKFQPLVVGHFMEFDYHVVSADFNRAGVDNPLTYLPRFCTMLASSYYVRDPSLSHLRLGELYIMLFDTKLDEQHNAYADAHGTAMCFFELFKRGDITDLKIESQQKDRLKKSEKEFPWLISLVIILTSAILIYFLL
ncbi:MAG TPA: 3'-5' exonuclease [Pedobacter sp.]